jgi:peptide/nickel transport system substrate-binding protein
MSAFADYYKGTPRINRFEIHAYDTPDSIVQALRSGQVNAAADLSPMHVAQADVQNYRVISRPVNSGVYALFNNDSPVLKDKVVRKALQAATDTSLIRKSIERKVPSIDHPRDRSKDQVLSYPALDLPFTAGQLSGDEIPKAPAVNTKIAAELLDSAGWKMVDGVRKNADGQLLSLTIATTKNPTYEKALETLVGQWRQLGVIITTNVVDTNDRSSNFVQTVLQQRAYDVILYELSIGADPDVYAYWHSSQAAAGGFNFSNYKNSTADAALSSARAGITPELRNVKYKTFAAQWLDDAPAIGLYQSVAEYVVNRQVRSVSADATLISPQDRYNNVLYWSVATESVYKTP